MDIMDRKLIIELKNKYYKYIKRLNDGLIGIYNKKKRTF